MHRDTLPLVAAAEAAEIVRKGNAAFLPSSTTPATLPVALDEASPALRVRGKAFRQPSPPPPLS